MRVGLTFAAALGVWLVVGYSAAQRACAHDPRFVCSPRNAAHAVSVPDASKSWAYYGGLARDQSDVFTFRLSRSTAVPWSLLVDSRDAKNPARPAAELFNSAGSVIAGVNFAGGGSTFYEPFSRESYLQSDIKQLRLLPQTYIIIVTMSGAMRQRYVMAIGDAEHFSPFEIPYVAGAITRIRAQRY